MSRSSYYCRHCVLVEGTRLAARCGNNGETADSGLVRSGGTAPREASSFLCGGTAASAPSPLSPPSPPSPPSARPKQHARNVAARALWYRHACQFTQNECMRSDEVIADLLVAAGKDPAGWGYDRIVLVEMKSAMHSDLIRSRSEGDCKVVLDHSTTSIPG